MAAGLSATPSTPIDAVAGVADRQWDLFGDAIDINSARRKPVSRRRAGITARRSPAVRARAR
jgi:hypothetical protein